jgi:adenylate cyclase
MIQMPLEQQQLTAIVSADVVDYSRLMGLDESGTLSGLKAHIRELIDPKVSAYGGRTVKSKGDGLLLEFPSVVDAVRCAVDVQRGMAERNAEVTAERQIKFRIGIDVGDIIIDSEDIVGDGVNVAARLQTLAEPGGICVSRAVRDQVPEKITFTLVKNAAYPIEAYRIRDEPTAETVVLPQPTFAPGTLLSRVTEGGRWLWLAWGVLAIGLAGVAAWTVLPYLRPASAPPQALSVAILPFAVPADSPADEQFANALTQDLTTALGRWRWAAVKFHRPAASTEGVAVDRRALGGDLNVRYLVDGEVRHAGGRISVITHLIDAETGTFAWSDRLEFAAIPPAEDRSVQGARLAQRLRGAIAGAEMRRVVKHPDTLSASDLVLRGRIAWNAEADWANKALAARKLYDEALRIDPSFVPALVAKASMLDGLLTNDLGADRSQIDQRMDELDTVTARAVAIDRNDPDGWFWRSQALEWLGRWDDASAANATAEALDPFDTRLLSDRAVIALAGDRPDQALSLAEQSAEMARLGDQGQDGFALRMVCKSNLMQARYAAAVRACEQAAARNGWWVNQALLAAAYAQQGDMAKAASAKAALFKQQPGFTIERFKASDPASTSTAYVQRAETHVYSGLRKAGIVDR